MATLRKADSGRIYAYMADERIGDIRQEGLQWVAWIPGETPYRTYFLFLAKRYLKAYPDHKEVFLYAE